MAFIKIFDNTGDMEITVFSKEYADKRDMLDKNQIILAKISRRVNKEEVSYIAEQIERLEEKENE